ncbi:ceramidase [Mycena pura]|uniref:Ceramidase n=1 Tax=Mycena pura TaxID=153505 RepID=A0AAD6UYT5_9AGAR|nr:ceramidase [Mycena pura]
MANSISNIATIAFAAFGAFFNAAEDSALLSSGMGLVGFGSFWFHATLLYHAQLADELPMIYLTTTTLWLLFDQDSGFTFKTGRTRLLTLILTLFNTIFTWTYYLNRNPLYHQVVFGTLLLSIAFRIYYLLTRSTVGTRIPVEKKKTIAIFFGSGVAQFVLAFLLWNLDNIFCDTITRWKVSVGWPLAFLLEGHSWWHVASGTYMKFIGIQYLTLCMKDDPRKFTLQYKMGLPYVKRVNKKLD